MAVYIAILRGVNVGGNPLRMERLRELWIELGFKNARTYLQSGNVVFGGASLPAKSRETIERKLAGETRLPVSVILRTATELGRVIADNPFTKERPIDLSKLHVTFLNVKPSKKGLTELSGADWGADRFHCSGKEVYLYCPNGYGTTRLSNNRLEKALAATATTRNWNTVNTLYEMTSR